MGVYYQTPDPSETDDMENVVEMGADLDNDQEEEEMLILENDEQIEAYLSAVSSGQNDADEEDNDDDYLMEDSTLIDPPQDDAVKIFTGHKEGVFSVGVDPLGKFLVSGSQDHSAVVWELASGQESFRCTGHEDSVTCVTFNSDGRYLATGDMAGLVQVWTTGRGRTGSNGEANWQLMWQNWVTELQWLSWHPSPKAAILMAGAGANDGSVALWPVLSPHSPKYLPGVGGACLAGEILPDGKHLVTLYETGQLRVWDLKTEQTVKNISLLSLKKPKEDEDDDSDDEKVSTKPPSESAVVSLSCRQPDGDLVAVGAEGSFILVHLGQRAGTQRIAVEDQSTVEALGFSRTHPFLAFGTVNGLLGVFDINSMQMRSTWVYNKETSCGISGLVWSKQSPIFFTAGLDARLVAWDARTCLSNPEPLAVWYGHRAMLLDCQLLNLPEHNGVSQEAVAVGGVLPERYVVTSSDDATLRLFDVHSTLTSSDGESFKQTLVECSEDNASSAINGPSAST